MGLDSARTVAVNTLVACEVAYLFERAFPFRVVRSG